MLPVASFFPGGGTVCPTILELQQCPADVWMARCGATHTHWPHFRTCYPEGETVPETSVLFRSHRYTRRTSPPEQYVRKEVDEL